LNVTIHHQWANLFTLHVYIESQICNSSDASFDNLDFNNEKFHCTPIKLMIHNFLEPPKIIAYENIIYSIAPNQHFHLLGLFKDKHLKELKFSTLFMANLDNFQKVFHINK
jgi:hypothetical protein